MEIVIKELLKFSKNSMDKREKSDYNKHKNIKKNNIDICKSGRGRETYVGSTVKRNPKIQDNFAGNIGGRYLQQRNPEKI